jgi:hypothetical protein
LADGYSYADWVVRTSNIRHVDEDWPAPGARIHHSVGIWPALIDVTTVRYCEPLRRLVLDAHGGPLGRARVTLTLRDRLDGCRIEMSEAVSGGLGGLLPAPLCAAALVPRNGESMRRLIDLAERRHRQSISPAYPRTRRRRDC